MIYPIPRGVYPALAAGLGMTKKIYVNPHFECAIHNSLISNHNFWYNFLN